MDNTYWDSFDCQIQCEELIPPDYEIMNSLTDKEKEVILKED